MVRQHLVKLRKRVLRQRYKRKNTYEYARYSFDFPAKFNSKIQPLVGKKFEIQIIYEDAAKQETLKISLTREKTTQNETTTKKLL
jgi:hypothetical protein